MKKLLHILVLLLTVLTASAEGIYIVNTELKAWPWKQYKESFGDVLGIYVEKGDVKMLTFVGSKFCTNDESYEYSAENFDKHEELAKKFNLQALMCQGVIQEYEARALLQCAKEYNEASFYAYKLKGGSILDWEQPIEVEDPDQAARGISSDHGMWVTAPGKEVNNIMFSNGIIKAGDKSVYARTICTFWNDKDVISKRIVKQDGTARPIQTQQSNETGKMQQASNPSQSQDGIYIVNDYFKAWPWEQYNESNGKPIGIYVEQNGSKVFTDIHCKYQGYTDMINLEYSVRKTGQHLPETRNDIKLLYDNCDDFNEAFGKAYRLSGQNMANYKDPIGKQHCLWLRDGHVSFFDHTGLPNRDSQTYFMALFNDNYVAKVNKQAAPSHPLKTVQTGKASQTQKSVQAQKPAPQQTGSIKATASVRTIDKSGAHYQNRGYTYTNLIEDVSVTLSNINAYFRNPPSGMLEGGCPIVRVYLVKFLPNGNPETVGTYDIDVIPDQVKDEWKSPQTQTVRFKTPWGRLWNRYGRGTVKYQYQIAIPRKAGPELLYKTPVRQITITNMPQPRR